MQSIWNFRELAKDYTNRHGKKIKPQRIFRSGSLNYATEDDINKLKQLGIKRIYDLRSQKEISQSQEHHGIEIMSYDVGNTESATPMDHDFFVKVSKSGARKFMHYLYGEHLPHSPMIKPLMHAIIEETEPFLFHCAAGKDRTGVIAALLMHVLGFTEDQIISEYIQLDNRILPYGRASLEKDPSLTTKQIEQLDPLHIVESSYIKAFIQAIKSEYQSLDYYIHHVLDITQNQIEQFIQRYMTETS